jgi:hypothetical protein
MPRPNAIPNKLFGFQYMTVPLESAESNLQFTICNYHSFPKRFSVPARSR